MSQSPCLISLLGRDQQNFDLVINPQSIRMVVLPACVTAERLNVAEMIPSDDVLLDLDGMGKPKFKTLLFTESGDRIELYHRNVHHWSTDMRQLSINCNLLLLESIHLNYKERRVLVNMDVIETFRYRANEKRKHHRLYVNFQHADSRMFFEAEDSADLNRDAELLQGAVPDRINPTPAVQRVETPEPKSINTQVQAALTL
jgi:hypothetical protein